MSLETLPLTEEAVAMSFRVRPRTLRLFASAVGRDGASLEECLNRALLEFARSNPRVSTAGWRGKTPRVASVALRTSTRL